MAVKAKAKRKNKKYAGYYILEICIGGNCEYSGGYRGNVCCLQSFASELLGIFCIELCGGKYCELFPE